MAVKRSGLLRTVYGTLFEDDKVEVTYPVFKLTPALQDKADALILGVDEDEDDELADLEPDEDVDTSDPAAARQLARQRATYIKAKFNRLRSKEDQERDWYKAARILEEIGVVLPFEDDSVEPPVTVQLGAEAVREGRYPLALVWTAFYAIFGSQRPKQTS